MRLSSGIWTGNYRSRRPWKRPAPPINATLPLRFKKNRSSVRPALIQSTREPSPPREPLMPRLKHTVLASTAAAALVCAPIAPASAAVPLLMLIGHALAAHHLVGAAVRAAARSLAVASATSAVGQSYAYPSSAYPSSAYPQPYAPRYAPQYAPQYEPQYAPPVYYRSAPPYAEAPPAYYVRPRVYYAPRAYYRQGVTYARPSPRYERAPTAYAPRIRYARPSYYGAGRAGGYYRYRYGR